MYPDGTIINYIFWMVIGILQIVIFRGIDAFVKEYNPNNRWWKTALLYGCFLSFSIIVFAGFTLKGEGEGNAGWYMIGFFGVFHFIAGAVLVRLLVLTKGRSAV